jgi:hypothetical protein
LSYGKWSGTINLYFALHFVVRPRSKHQYLIFAEEGIMSEKTRKIRRILCCVGVAVVLIYTIQLMIVVLLYADVSRVWHLSAILLLIDGAPASQLVLPIIHFVIHIVAGLLAIFNISVALNRKK